MEDEGLEVNGNPAPLLRAEDVARILGITRSGTYNLAKAGVIPHVAFKTRGDRMTIRFRTEDVSAFIEGNLQGGTRRFGID